ncbi:MAG: hypothetical protein OIN89_05620 [Candidatus Methanoperedens sp.]|jgi:cytochrome c biogenesis factor|nr:hypothetical protein [Candidatus Methanoperedens sp.]PKL53896.1 MAG: hypothetical protein CVV36_04735 [Candidatus Methanoperedenaceae archaeon HGW-Methanoperedenaceae-1]
MNSILIVLILAIVFVIIGSFYATRSMILWRRTSISGVGAAVTKSRSFLHNNFVLVILVGAFAGLHVLLELIQDTVSIESPYINGLFYVLYYITLLAIVAILSVLSFMWYKLLLKINEWDKRLISGKK